MRLMISLFLIFSYASIGFSMDSSTENAENEMSIYSLPVSVKAEILKYALDNEFKFHTLAVLATVDKSFNEATNEVMHGMELRFFLGELTDDNVERISQIGTLNFSFSQYRDDAHSGDALKRSGKLRNLTELALSSAPRLKIGQLQFFSELINLTGLSLPYHSDICDDDLKAFENCTRLQWVRLAGTQISSKGLMHLKNSKYLISLQMEEHIYISNDDVKAIVETFPYLRTLNVHGEKVNDDAVADLSTLAFLSDLYVTGTSITHVGIKDLKLALTKCTIRGVNTLVTKDQLEELKKLFKNVY